MPTHPDSNPCAAIKLQVWYAEHSRTQGGRIPAIHCLTEHGAQAVYAWTGLYPKRVLRSDPSPFTFFHRLQIVKVRAAFDAAAVLQIPNAGQADPTNLAIFFEIDLSREGLAQCQRKLPGYAALIEHRTYP